MPMSVSQSTTCLRGALKYRVEAMTMSSRGPLMVMIISNMLAKQYAMGMTSSTLRPSMIVARDHASSGCLQLCLLGDGIDSGVSQ